MPGRGSVAGGPRAPPLAAGHGYPSAVPPIVPSALRLPVTSVSPPTPEDDPDTLRERMRTLANVEAEQLEKTETLRTLKTMLDNSRRLWEAQLPELDAALAEQAELEHRLDRAMARNDEVEATLERSREVHATKMAQIRTQRGIMGETHMETRDRVHRIKASIARGGWLSLKAGPPEPDLAHSARAGPRAEADVLDADGEGVALLDGLGSRGELVATLAFFDFLGLWAHNLAETP